MPEAGKPADASLTTKQDDEIYAPPDQSLFDFSTKHEDRTTERRRKEKAQIAHQQKIVLLIAGAILGLGVAGALIAIIVSTLQK
jgi:hypothetical protein